MYGRVMDKKRDKNKNKNRMSRMSSLPDEILHHILSFMDIQNGVQTCVLSRRWKNVWKGISCLNFNFVHPITNHWFDTFIHKVLTLRNTSDIHTLSCYIEGPINDNSLSFLIDHALHHNVKILELNCANSDPFKIPDTVFTSKSLSVLSLSGAKIVLPDTISSVNLKELFLSRVSLYEDINTDHRDLISDCPNLKCLTISNCYFHALKSLKISATQLTNLEIMNPRGAFTSKICPWYCNVIICAPNLSSFDYACNFPIVCSIENTLNMESVNINIFKSCYVTEEEMGLVLYAMLLQFQDAKSVTLSPSAFQMLEANPLFLQDEAQKILDGSANSSGVTQ